ncbi:MAG TPA: urea transporter [Pirellulales bacterium]|jgi:urea transporter/tetratricopeptide (TPR) repeat protein|nr:urea transporter [Pirellulales bacterium]
MPAAFQSRIDAILRGCAAIFFLSGARNGLCVLAIGLLNPRIALGGLLALGGAYGLARLMRIEAAFLQTGHELYNPFLVGCALGARFELGPLAIVLAVLAGMITLAVTLLAAQAIVVRGRLPLLSLTFSLVGILCYLVTTRYAAALSIARGGLALADATWGLPLAARSFFQACGAIVFTPTVTSGLLLALLVCASSRILGFLAVAGFFTGVGVRALLGQSFDTALIQPDNFNFILIPMGLGGMFLIPSLRSALLALAATAVAPFVLDLFAALLNPLGVPSYTLPFCTLVIGMLLLLRLARFPDLTVALGRTPEEILENATVARLRYPGTLRTLFLPFAGRWTVWQGFEGRWTHQGIWRHAYDFVITDEEGRTHRGCGSQLTDYYCYRMPVLSPIRGRVVRVADRAPDNPVGAVGGGNWGNYVVLEDPRGFFVEISHFSAQSIRVQEGEWVERGMPLGLCGNSGNSPQPHLHIQVQASDQIGAATLPFSFASYQHASEFHANDLPPEGAVVEPAYPDRALEEATNFVLDETLTYDVFRQGRPVDQLALKTKLAPDGTYYFETAQGRLYFGKADGTFYVYRVEGDDADLRRLALAAPRWPLFQRPGLSWIDFAPATLVLGGLVRFAARLGALVRPALGTVKIRSEYVGYLKMRTTAVSPWLRTPRVAHVELDPKCFLASVRSGDWELRRAPMPQAGPFVPLCRGPRRAELWTSALAATLLFLASVAAVVAADRLATGESEIRAAIQQSVQSEQANQYAAAIEALTKAYPGHANHYLLNLRLGWLSYLAANYPDAEKYYQTAMQIAPKSVEAALGNSLALTAAGKWAAAEGAAHKVLALDSNNFYGKLRLAIALRMQKKDREAAEAIAPLLAAYPSNASVVYEVELLKTTDEPAAQALKFAETFDAKTNEAWQASLQAEKEGRYAEAAKALSDSYKAHSKSYLLNARLGWLALAAGDARSAEPYYELATRIAPAALEAKLGHISTLLVLYRYPEAATLAAQVVRADPNNYYGNFWHAFALRWSGKGKTVEPILEKLTAAYPSDVNTLAELAIARAAQPQRKAAARELFQEIIALDPKNTYAQQQLILLQ